MHYHAPAVFTYGKSVSTLLPLREYLQFSLLISFSTKIFGWFVDRDFLKEREFRD
jgi:hypothetical protein